VDESLANFINLPNPPNYSHSKLSSFTVVKLIVVAASIHTALYSVCNFSVNIQIASEPTDPPKQHNIAVLAPDNLEISQLIGNGSCGQVHKVCDLLVAASSE